MDVAVEIRRAVALKVSGWYVLPWVYRESQLVWSNQDTQLLAVVFCPAACRPGEVPEGVKVW